VSPVATVGSTLSLRLSKTAFFRLAGANSKPQAPALNRLLFSIVKHENRTSTKPADFDRHRMFFDRLHSGRRLF
jgi:hypothetical protein